MNNLFIPHTRVLLIRPQGESQTDYVRTYPFFLPLFSGRSTFHGRMRPTDGRTRTMSNSLLSRKTKTEETAQSHHSQFSPFFSLQDFIRLMKYAEKGKGEKIRGRERLSEKQGTYLASSGMGFFLLLSFPKLLLRIRQTTTLRPAIIANGRNATFVAAFISFSASLARSLVP